MSRRDAKELDSPAAGPVPAAVLLHGAREMLASARMVEARDTVRAAFGAPDAGDALRASAGRLLCELHYRLGDLHELVETGELVQVMLAEQARDAERFELLRWMSLGCCELGRFERALSCASQALAHAQATDDAKERVLALNAMGACFERMGDPWQAERLLGDALATAQRHGLVHQRLVTLNNLTAMLIGLFHIVRDGGDPDETRAALQRALIHAERAREMALGRDDPFYQTFVEGNLAEVLLYLGRGDDAMALLLPALDRAREHGLQAQVWRMRCTLGEAHLAFGNALLALDGLHALVDEIAEAGPNAATLLRAHHALHRAHRLLGEHEHALRHHEAAHRLERQRAMQQLKAQSRMLVTRMEVEHAKQQAERLRTRAAELEMVAHRDPLTGIANRRGMERRLDAIAARAAEETFQIAVAMIDLDHFKQVNDRHGHAVGDAALVQLARLLEQHTRPGDVLARLGGEEFGLVITDLAPAQVREVAERLRAAAQRHAWQPPLQQLTLSVGVSHAVVGADRPLLAEVLFERADAALYRAKNEGRNRVACADD